MVELGVEANTAICLESFSADGELIYSLEIYLYFLLVNSLEIYLYYMHWLLNGLGNFPM
jgi:hypothetical protein